MDDFYHGRGRRPQPSGEREWRPLWVSLGDLFAELALAHLEVGRRNGQPRMAYRAGGHLIKAAAYYGDAGLGRRARAVARLLERSRAAWLAHEAAEGFA